MLRKSIMLQQHRKNAPYTVGITNHSTHKEADLSPPVERNYFETSEPLFSLSRGMLQRDLKLAARNADHRQLRAAAWRMDSKRFHLRHDPLKRDAIKSRDTVQLSRK